MKRRMDPASSNAIATLKIRKACPVRRNRCMPAPAASQTRQLGSAARMNSTARVTDHLRAVAVSAREYAPTAAAQTSHALGFTHWKAATPQNPTWMCSSVSSGRPDLAILHANQSRKATPHHLSPSTMNGFFRTRLPSPKATRNSITPIPTTWPNRVGRPRTTPTAAPVDARIRLLGPGVMAATRAKSRSAMVCPAVTGASLPPPRNSGVSGYAQPW